MLRLNSFTGWFKGQFRDMCVLCDCPMKNGVSAIVMCDVSTLLDRLCLDNFNNMSVWLHSQWAYQVYSL